MYYFLDQVIADEKKHFFFRGVLYDNDKRNVENVFDDGKIHENLSPPFLLVLNDSISITKNRILSDKIAPIASSLGLLFLVSPKAQEFLSKHVPDDIQMFDINVKGGNYELYDYKIVKVLNKIDCVDLEKSDLRYDANYDSIREAENIVLNEEKIPDNKQIFLLGKRNAAVIKF